MAEVTNAVRPSLTTAERNSVEEVGGPGSFSTPLETVGKSGIRHKFTFGTEGKGGANLACDVVVGSAPVDETRVLSLFIKVYDVGVKQAMLCVVPSLSSEAMKLANQYKILVVEARDEVGIAPALVGALKKTVRGAD